MDRSRPDQILETWNAVAATAVRPPVPPRRTVVRTSLPGLSLAGAAVIVGALVLGVMWLGGPGSDRGVGGVTSPEPTATATTEPTTGPSEAPSTTPSGSLPTYMSPTPEPLFGTCAVADLHAAITAWEGAAGSRIGTVEMTYTGSTPCTIPSTSEVWLIDVTGAALINGTGVDSSTNESVTVGDRLTTLVRASNGCGEQPTRAVTVAFATDTGRVVATPLTPTDKTMPPCNGPGEASIIEMQPWTR
jgi:hypothetical protein